MRPCDEGLMCIYKGFDWGANVSICEIDYSGDECPYELPWGKQKYKRDIAAFYGKIKDYNNPEERK